MKLTDFKALSFDCYGTLIDWERGICTALAPLVAKVRTPLEQDALLELFAHRTEPSARPRTREHARVGVRLDRSTAR